MALWTQSLLLSMSFGKDVLVVKLEKHLDEGFVISRDSLSFGTNTRKQEKAEDIRSKYRNGPTFVTTALSTLERAKRNAYLPSQADP